MDVSITGEIRCADLVARVRALGHEVELVPAIDAAPWAPLAILVVDSVASAVALCRGIRALASPPEALLVMITSGDDSLDPIFDAGADAVSDLHVSSRLLQADLRMLEKLVIERRRARTTVSGLEPPSSLRVEARLEQSLADQGRLEREVAEAHDFLVNVIDTVADPVFVMDREHRFIFVNQAMCRLMRRERHEVIGHTAHDYVASHEADVFREKDELVFETGATNENEETATDSSGTQRTMLTKKAMFVDREGRKVLVGVIRDLTAQKQMQRQLALTERLVAVGTLAAGVAHEINNPLAYVLCNLGFVDEAMAALPADARAPLGEVEEALREAFDGAHRIHDIVQDMARLSRADDETRSPVDVGAIIDASLRVVANQVRQRAQVVRDVEAVPLVQASASRLGQLFVNLLANAIQALPEDGIGRNEIQVTVGTTAGGRVQVQIGDNGCGMTRDVMSRIFDPFFTTKAVGLGTGLGLSICHGIVSDMGGELTVESEVGRGTTFSVVLPAAVLPISARPRLGLTPQGSVRPRVLVIDDEPIISTSIKRILRRDHDVFGVIRAQEALALLSAGERYDLILCDLMMPEMTGIDLFDALRLVSPEMQLRVAFMTGGAFTPRGREFLERLGKRYLPKPFATESLRAFVSSAIAAAEEACALSASA